MVTGSYFCFTLLTPFTYLNTNIFLSYKHLQKNNIHKVNRDTPRFLMELYELYIREVIICLCVVHTPPIIVHNELYKSFYSLYKNNLFIKLFPMETYGCQYMPYTSLISIDINVWILQNSSSLGNTNRFI